MLTRKCGVQQGLESGGDTDHGPIGGFFAQALGPAKPHVFGQMRVKRGQFMTIAVLAVNQHGPKSVQKAAKLE